DERAQQKVAAEPVRAQRVGVARTLQERGGVGLRGLGAPDLRSEQREQDQDDDHHGADRAERVSQEGEERAHQGVSRRVVRRSRSDSTMSTARLMTRIMAAYTRARPCTMP